MLHFFMRTLLHRVHAATPHSSSETATENAPIETIGAGCIRYTAAHATCHTTHTHARTQMRGQLNRRRMHNFTDRRQRRRRGWGQTALPQLAQVPTSPAQKHVFTATHEAHSLQFCSH